MQKTFFIVVVPILIVWLFFVPDNERAYAFDFTDIGAIGAAYMTHLSLHEIGHQIVAEESGADSPKMSFFTKKDGRLYPGLSTYKDIPKESKCPMQRVVIGWQALHLNMARILKRIMPQITYYILKNIHDWENVNENSYLIVV